MTRPVLTLWRDGYVHITVIIFAFLLYYFFFLFSIFISVVIPCLPFVANKRVHTCKYSKMLKIK